ncbi:MAG TPA: exodeoxyribonuclease VII large subunit [Woeseiaceae bacterium]|nr:exodeoxyribonuclease VII large subunit [Woeseiaceae bacterium]
MSVIPKETPAASALTVSELNRQARLLIEQGIGRQWVEGEVSNLARPASGHLYFSLKDSAAQIRCAWFRQRQLGARRRLRNGDKIVVLGRVSLYEPRGEYQLIVEQAEPAGEGELRRRFELLKKKLAAEGLFDRERKKALPALPRRIGVITSPSGAAIRDILTVLKRRFPAVPVVLYPAAVQGAAATGELIAALGTAGRRVECDVLIVGRGGGSLEDLWAFNEEALARALAACPIPTVSAVGHEIDFTVADFVSDLRAPTPSGAAELVVPDREEWLRKCDVSGARLASQMRRHLENDFQALDWLARRLKQASPALRLRHQHARLGELTRRLGGAMRHDVTRRGRAADALFGRLLRRSPAARLEWASRCLRSLRPRLERAGRLSVERATARLRHAERGLKAVSPLATLERGYAIVTDASSGRVLSDAAEVNPGAEITARLARGRLRATVHGTETEAGKGTAHEGPGTLSR